MKEKITLLVGAMLILPGTATLAGEREARMVLRVVGPDGEPLARAKVGSGMNFFESSEDGPPQRRVMWLRKHRRQWPFRSNDKGEVVLTGDYAKLRQFYAMYEARGWVGYVALEGPPDDGVVAIRLEPACAVHGRLVSSAGEALGIDLSETTAWVYSRGRSIMYFVSERLEYEFLLPTGQYEIRANGRGPNGFGTERTTKSFEIARGQRELDLETIDLKPTPLSLLYGKPAPELADIAEWKNSEPLTLAQLRGKVVVLDFWGFWCGPCLSTMPKLMEIYDAYKDKEVVFIAVHDNRISSVKDLDAKLVETVKGFWEGRELPFAIAIDSGPGRGATHAAYDISGWPTTLVIDRRGKLLGEFSPWGELATKLDELLGENRDMATD